MDYLITGGFLPEKQETNDFLPIIIPAKPKGYPGAWAEILSASKVNLEKYLFLSFMFFNSYSHFHFYFYFYFVYNLKECECGGQILINYKNYIFIFIVII